MTVRVAPVWNAMVKKEGRPPSAVLFVDDADKSVQVLRANYDRDEVVGGAYVGPPMRKEVIDNAMERAEDELSGLLLLGLVNTMYIVNEYRDFDTREEAADYVFNELWSEAKK